VNHVTLRVLQGGAPFAASRFSMGALMVATILLDVCAKTFIVRGSM
jgi:hypothetical protein